MSFYFRDKPRFGERFRGKSGDKLLQEIQQQLDEDSKSFFEPTTNNRSSRFPFDRRAEFPKELLAQPVLARKGRGHLITFFHPPNFVQQRSSHFVWRMISQGSIDILLVLLTTDQPLNREIAIFDVYICVSV
ncbi:BAG domain-containing protein Samui-like isoform X1 [Vespula maculifrons]|uniref:BAG domain-containing protein Samui-like isoform X1 n=1 Tax=Vespula maculifrons TaxID=7453 RepID=A0ABD2BBT7_VESMC